MRRCFQLPDDLFDQLVVALGPLGAKTDPAYSALGIEHIVPHSDGDCFVPLRAQIPHGAITVRALPADRLAAMITPLLPRLPGSTRAMLAGLASPISQAPPGDGLPVIVDDDTARAWRLCRSCLRVFHTQRGRPTQRYCDNSCGNLAYAWQTWAHNIARYPHMAEPQNVDGARAEYVETRPKPAAFGIVWSRRPGCWVTWRMGTQRRLLQQFIGRMGYPLSEIPPRWQGVARYWRKGIQAVRLLCSCVRRKS